MLRLWTSIWPDRGWYGGVSMPAKATSAFLEWKRRTSPIFAISWGRELGHCLLYQELDRIGLWHGTEMPIGRGDHAFACGNINIYTVHVHSPIQNAQLEPIFFALPIQSIG